MSNYPTERPAAGRKVIMFNPNGTNSSALEAAKGLLKANLLAEYHVPIALFPGDWLDRVASMGPLTELRRRRFDPAFKPYIKTFPWLEVGRQLASKVGLTSLIRHETGVFNIDSVSKNIDRRVAASLGRMSRRGVGGVYSCEDVTAYSFQAAKDIGLKCLYDMPIGYWRTAHRLLRQEADRWPAWASTLTGFLDSPAKLARKDEELRLADRIFAASTFTAQTLRDFPGSLAPVEVVIYGFPPVPTVERHYDTTPGRPLKLLFVGSLSQRKGIADLFAVVDKLGSQVELTLVGNKAVDDCEALNTALAKHRWIPTMPHEQVLALMRKSDVLVFPSLFEGFGMVISEAMSQGTPVITTDRTAGPDIIRHGHDGWIIPAGSTDALQEAIETMIGTPGLVAELGREAMKTAARRPWPVFGRELAEAVAAAL